MLGSRRGRCVAVPGLCASAVLLAVGSAARAQTTRLIMEASVDGAQTWASEVVAVPGQVVYFRLRAQLAGATALGLSGMTLQPVLTNFVSGTDEGIPFSFPGVDAVGSPGAETEYLGRQVSAMPVTNTGRLFPYGTPGQAGIHIPWAHEDTGNVLRFADQKATTATLNVAWGLAIAQQPLSIAGTTFGGSMDAVVFRYCVRLNAPVLERVAWPTIDGGLAGGMVRWYLDSSGTSVLNSTHVELVPATVVPGPGAAGILGMAGMVATRRRRTRPVRS